MILAAEGRSDDLRRLCFRYGVQRLDLFGSAATDRHLPEQSDLDLVVEFPAYDFQRFCGHLFRPAGVATAGLREADRPSGRLCYQKSLLLAIGRAEKRRPSMRLEAKKYLHDIQCAVGLLREFIAGKDVCGLRAARCAARRRGTCVREHRRGDDTACQGR